MGSINIDIRVRRGVDWRRAFPYVLTGLFLLYVYGLLWWALAAALVAYGLYRVYLWHLAAVAEAEALTARADAQHQQVMSGDERGTYGPAAEAMERFRAVQQ